jgi:cobalt-zinc-cadmium efflux system membrane fusion protein
MNNKQKAAIAAILLIGALAGGMILYGGKAKPQASAEHDDHAEAGAEGEAPKGPHGGQLLAKDDLSVELVLNEQGEAPRLEVYLSRQGKSVQPGGAEVTATLARPGEAPELITFVAVGGGMVSKAAIEEPHVFEGTVAVRSGGKAYSVPFEMHEGKIELTDAQVAANSIVVQPAAPARIRSSVQLPGEIRFNADRTAHVVPRVAGVVESVAASLGEHVKKGQVMATMSSTAMADLRSDLQSAQQRLELARTTYAREKKLWEEKISAEQDYLQARQALKEGEIAARNAGQKLAAYGAASASPGALSLYQIRAPFDGTVVEKQIAAGEAVKDDKAIFTVSDLSSVWMEVVVPAKDLSTVRTGAKAEVRATALESSATGKVSYVSALVGEQTRTATARIVVANPRGVWRPGLFATAEIGTEERDVPVAVSAQAVHSLDGKTVVFLRVPGGFVAQPVTTGLSDGRFIEIVKGMKPGLPYAAAGSNVVKAEHGKAGAEDAH